MRRFSILRTLIPVVASLAALLIGARPVAAEVRQYLVVTDPAYASNTRARMTSLGLTNDGMSLAGLASANPDTTRANYRAIFVPLHLSGPYFAALRAMAATGGVLERFVNGGGTLVLNVGGFTGEIQLDIAPGGVDYDGGMTHSAEAIVTPSHPYFTGAGYGGTLLNRGNFGNWLPTDYGYLAGLPAGTAILLANAHGPAMVEYRWGRGRVIVSTLSCGRPGFPDRTGPTWNNLIRYAAWVPPFAASSPGPAPEKVAPSVTITNRDNGGQLVRGPSGRPAYLILIKDPTPSSGLAEVKVEGTNYNVVAVNGKPVALSPLPYTEKFAVGSAVTQWEIMVERISYRMVASLSATAIDASGNKTTVSR